MVDLGTNWVIVPSLVWQVFFLVALVSRVFFLACFEVYNFRKI